MQFGNSKWPQLLYLDCVLKDSFLANLLKCNIMDWPLFTIDWPILLYTHSSEEQQASLNLLLNQCLGGLQCLWPQCLKLKELHVTSCSYKICTMTAIIEMNSLHVTGRGSLPAWRGTTCREPANGQRWQSWSRPTGKPRGGVSTMELNHTY